jgi:hypothetical protein
VSAVRRARPEAKPGPSRDAIDREIEALAKRAGGREALLQRLLAPPCSDQDPPKGADKIAEPPRSRGFDILLRLSPEDLVHLDEACRTAHTTRNRWVASLIHKALKGQADLGSADRLSLAAALKELRKIEASAAQSSRAIAHWEQLTRALSARLCEMAQMRGQMTEITGALDAVLRGNDEYWRRLVEGASALTEKPSPHSSMDKPMHRRPNGDTDS